MNRSRTLLLVALAVALTLSIAACGSSKKTQTTKPMTFQYPTAFVNSFIKGCDTNGGTSYCECVLSYIKGNVSYKTVVASEKAITGGTKPSWYTKAIEGCHPGS